jgi:DNA-binding GntR family transcriptional regulator
LRKHDAETARSVMQQHVLEAADFLVHTLEQRGVFDDR